MNNAININAVKQHILDLASVSLAGVFLGLSFVDPQYSWLVFISFVPVLIVTHGKSLVLVYLYGVLFGFAVYGVGSFALVDFFNNLEQKTFTSSILSASVVWFYSSQLLALIFLVYEWLRRKSSCSVLIVFPLTVVFFFTCFPALFPISLGTTQAENLLIVQAIDIFGVYGLNFLIAFINVFSYSFIKKSVTRSQLLTGCLFITSWFSYGSVQLYYWDNLMGISPHVVVGLVQPNQDVHYTGPDYESGYRLSYPWELAMTELLAKKGAEVIVWPETAYRGYFDNEVLQLSFNKVIDRNDVHLIFQDTSYLSDGEKILTNKLGVIDPSGVLIAEHTKSKLVPFGEKLPLVAKISFFEDASRNFFKGILNELTPGTGTRSIALSGLTEKLSIIPLICYETLFPNYSAMGASKDSASNVIIAVSNNNWFGQSAQPYQHQRDSLLRAIEIRATMIHAMNNGPSAVYLPNGRRIFSTSIGQRTAETVVVPIPPAEIKPTFFSKYASHIQYFFIVLFLIIFCITFLKSFLPTHSE